MDHLLQHAMRRRDALKKMVLGLVAAPAAAKALPAASEGAVIRIRYKADTIGAIPYWTETRKLGWFTTPEYDEAIRKMFYDDVFRNAITLEEGGDQEGGPGADCSADCDPRNDGGGRSIPEGNATVVPGDENGKRTFQNRRCVNPLPSSPPKLEEIKEDAIERGFAEYNPKTGEWKWKELPVKPEEKK